jgi:pilus assembly protein FimV
MHLNTRPPIVSFALKTLTSAVASAVFLSSAACAAGLGKLTVLSSLGQPLRAEIELTAVSSDEAAGLVAKLAAPDAFRLANIEFNPALLSLGFSVEQRNGRQYIKVTSTQPINEPFVDMLLELNWSSGRMVREYTFLLDPAELRATQSAQVAPPVDVLKQGVRPGAPAPASQAYRPAPPPAQAAQPARPRAERPARAADAATAGSPAAAAAEYKVRAGDTLGRIAAQLKPVDISLDMMLVALYRANPEAFIGHNMNRLKSGQILSVPDAETIRGTGEGDTHGVVVAHAADFNAYRNKLAGQVATAAPAKAHEATQSAAGKITAKVEERPTAANESKDQLKLSKATSAAAGAAGKIDSVSDEDRIAKDKALAEATARVKELEKNVSDLEQLMSVKNKAGSEAQKALAADLTPAAKPVAPVPAPVKKVELKKTPPPAPPAPEPSFADMLMDNITYVGAGAAVLLLALFGISSARRRKKDFKAPAEPSILGAPTDQAHSLFAETGGQSVDTNNSVFNSSFAPSASQLDTNEVDPVAEADVYIAYGRDAQAEEILKEALRTHPERYPVRLKLLEIYAARKDQRAFETQASEMYGMTKGQGDEWAQAAALGLSIDPLNPLYASAAAAAPAMPAPSSEDLAQQALLAQQLDATLAEEAPNSGLMDLDVDLAADAAPSAEPEPVAAAPAASLTDANTLDFDLGGLSYEPIAQIAPVAAPSQGAAVADLDFTSEPIAAAAAPAPSEESFDMAFDMAFDTPAAPVAPVEQKSLGDLSLDLASNDLSAGFDLADLSKEFDLPSIPSTPEPASDNAVFNHPLMDLDAMNFDLPATPGPADAARSGADDPLALPDLPVAVDDAPASQAAAAPQFDMSGIDLDLPVSEPDAMPTIDAGEMSAIHMEMETKLDLAIAYQEIGDKEGARELLDEVIKGGSSEQVSRANDMRTRLA